MEYSNYKQSIFERIRNKLINNTPDSIKDVKDFIKSAFKSGVISQEVLFLLEKVLLFSDLEVRDVMVNRSKIEVIKINDSFERIIEKINNNTHSRFPVIGNDKDEILGILHTKDLFKFFVQQDSFDLRPLLREVFFTPESKNLISLIKEFKDKHLHLAIVIDEFGGVSGIITFEDIIEQIIGNIEDEFDNYQENNILFIKDNVFRVDATTKLEEFNSFFGTNIGYTEVDTIGGYLVSRLGRLPKEKEEIELDKVNICISTVNLRRIHNIIVTKKN